METHQESTIIMFQYLTKFILPSRVTKQAYALYARVNDESRNSMFFSEWGVPDTLDGRFEMILLHMFLYLHSMKQMGEGTDTLQRKLIEAFFEDMDRSLREFGVGDTGVSKRVKNMANAFYGRINAFEQGIKDDMLLDEAIRTNIFGTVEEAPTDVSAIRLYMHQQLESLAKQPITSTAYAKAQAA